MNGLGQRRAARSRHRPPGRRRRRRSSPLRPSAARPRPRSGRRARRRPPRSGRPARRPVAPRLRRSTVEGGLGVAVGTHATGMAANRSRRSAAPRAVRGGSMTSAIMHAMATDTDTRVATTGERAPIELGPRRRPGDPVGVRAGARVARHRHAQGALRAVHRRPRGRRRRTAATFATIDPATEEPLAQVAKATAGRRRQGGPRRPPRPDAGRGARCPGRERAKYLFRIARILQERSREFAVLESMDSGKPIKESRDVDVPLAAAHFWYYAGWADKLDYAFPGRVAKPLGVAAQIIPWNFPLLMLAWKIAPALAAGNTVVLKPASTTPLSRAAVRRRLPPGRPAAGRRQHRHRAPARSGWRSSPTRTSTRSRSPARPRSASRSPRASPAPTRR